MTIVLDVIAVCRVLEEVPAPDPEPEPGLPPGVMPSPSSIFLIHVAPSPRLDPSAGDLGNVEIVDDEQLGEASVMKNFIVD